MQFLGLAVQTNGNYYQPGSQGGADALGDAKRVVCLATQARAKIVVGKKKPPPCQPLSHLGNNKQPEMPRAKRTLAEADANAETAPAAKRSSTGGKAGGKENGTSKPPKAAKQKKDKVTKNKDGRVPKDADGATWICICRPQDNDDEDEDDDVESENNATTTTSASKTVCDGGQGPLCMCRRPADLHPEYDWVMTKRGFEQALHWMHEQGKRCSDNFDLYIFNDYNGYGTQEVMENMLLAFDEAMNPAAAAGAGEEPLDLMLRLWAQVEGMALFLNDDLMEYNMIDDSASVARFAEIIGTAVLSTIDLLIARGMFVKNTNKNGAIRNIGLMLCRFIEFAQTQDDASSMNENGWVNRIVKLADEHGVAIEGKPDIEETLESIRADIEDEDEEPPSKAEATRYAKAKKKWTPKGDRDDEGSRVWRSWDWTAEFKAFRRERGVKVSPHGPLQGQMVSPVRRHC